MSIKDFEIISTLGKGSFGSVYKVRRKEDNQNYAMKKVSFAKLSCKEKEAALNEVRLIASIKYITHLVTLILLLIRRHFLTGALFALLWNIARKATYLLELTHIRERAPALLSKKSGGS